MTRQSKTALQFWISLMHFGVFILKWSCLQLFKGQTTYKQGENLIHTSLGQIQTTVIFIAIFISLYERSILTTISIRLDTVTVCSNHSRVYKNMTGVVVWGPRGSQVILITNHIDLWMDMFKNKIALIQNFIFSSCAYTAFKTTPFVQTVKFTHSVIANVMRDAYQRWHS